MKHLIRIACDIRVYYWVGDKPTMSQWICGGRPGWEGMKEALEPTVIQHGFSRAQAHEFIDKMFGQVVGLEGIEMTDPPSANCPACSGTALVGGLPCKQCLPADQEWNRQASEKLKRAALESKPR